MIIPRKVGMRYDLGADRNYDPIPAEFWSILSGVKAKTLPKQDF